MRSTLKFLIALAVAFVAMLTFRALVFTIYPVPSSALEREGLFSYGRLCGQPIEKDDLVALDDSAGNVQIGRCIALPGDTISYQQRTVIIPGKQNCARHDYYQIEPLGLVREEQIIGRVALVVYNHAPGQPFWLGYDARRLLLPK